MDFHTCMGVGTPTPVLFQGQRMLVEGDGAVGGSGGRHTLWPKTGTGVVDLVLCVSGQSLRLSAPQLSSFVDVKELCQLGVTYGKQSVQ